MLVKHFFLGMVLLSAGLGAKDRLRKICDVRTMLTNDSQGFRAHVEKQPDWANEKVGPVKLNKGGLYLEFVERGLL